MTAGTVNKQQKGNAGTMTAANKKVRIRTTKRRTLAFLF